MTKRRLWTIHMASKKVRSTTTTTWIRSLAMPALTSLTSYCPIRCSQNSRSGLWKQASMSYAKNRWRPRSSSVVVGCSMRRKMRTAVRHGMALERTRAIECYFNSASVCGEIGCQKLLAKRLPTCLRDRTSTSVEAARDAKPACVMGLSPIQ